MTTTVLELRQITKRFPGVLANDRVCLDVREGEVHAVLGENGAGKSTLMNVLYGLLRPDEGEIYVRGKLCPMRSPLDAMAQGIGMVHQNFMLLPNLTVAENVVLGREPRRGPFLRLADAVQEIKQVSAEYGLDVNPEHLVWQLSVGEQQRVEILKVLYRQADILILDEPTAVLSPPEVRALFKILKGIVAHGKSVVLITHKLNEVMELSDRITVLRRGSCQGTVNTRETDERELARMLVGCEVTAPIKHCLEPQTEVVAALNDVWVQGDRGLAAVRGVTLELHAGEIVGVAGVDGNGQSELAEAMAGLRSFTKGKFTLADADITAASPAARIARGVGYVPADRRKRGAALDLSIATNSVTKAHVRAPFSHAGVLQGEQIRQHADQLVRDFDVRCRSIATNAGTLSGGNLQKLIVGREIMDRPKLLIIEQPTRGLDISATSYVQKVLLEARNQGAAILLISADLDEVLLLGDRIIVMYEGAVPFECRSAEIDREEIGLAMAGFRGKNSAAAL